MLVSSNNSKWDWRYKLKNDIWIALFHRDICNDYFWLVRVQETQNKRISRGLFPLSSQIDKSCESHIILFIGIAMGRFLKRNESRQGH